jgi:hypothetical protein
MFNSISWQEFLTTIGVTVGSYYAITTLLLYSEEIKSIFNQKQSKSIESDANEDQKDSNESINLMGTVKYETSVNVPHEKSVGSEEITSQPLIEVEDAIDEVVVSTQDVLVAKSVAELLREIKTIVGELSQGNREEITSIYRSLLQNYSHLIGTNYQEEISLFINDCLSTNASHSFTLHEINSWWKETNE